MTDPVGPSMEAASDQVLARRRRVVLVIGAALLLVVVAVMVGSVLQTTEPRPEPLPGGDLLPWAARGELAGDSELVASAEALWRGGTDVDAATVVAPAGEVYLLWADQIAAGRLVLMQAVGVDGRPYVAQVSEQGDPAVLGLDTVQALPSDTPMVLVVTYGGNLRIPGLEPGRGSAYIQLLTDPSESDDSTGLWHYKTISGPGQLELLELKPNGMTKAFLQVDTSDPAGTPVVVSTTVGGRAAVAGTLAVRGGAMVPTSARVALADDPAWGPSGRIDGAEYTALLHVAADLRLTDVTGFVAASEEVEVDGSRVRASLVVFRAMGGGPSRVACVLSGSEEEPIADVVATDPAEVDLADVRVVAGWSPVSGPDGTMVVAVAAARPGAGQVQIEADGRLVAGPADSLVTVLDRPATLGPLVARLDGADGPGSTFTLQTWAGP